jgi:hypothetical protein
MTTAVYRSLLAMIGAVLIFSFSSSLWAQAPDIRIDLNFNKETYEYGEPIPVQIVVTNNSSSGILINRGFKATDFYLEMRLLDPTQKLVVPTREEFHDEFPDAPPLAWILHIFPDSTQRAIRVAGCESFPPPPHPDASLESYTADLRDHYDILLPGYYSAQVQVSVKTYEGVVSSGEITACEEDDFEWQGVLSSQTRFFYVQGSTGFTVPEGSAEAKVKPDVWQLKWKDDRGKPKKIKVEIKTVGELTLDDFNASSIKLNSISALEVKKNEAKIEVEFDRKLAVESLGDVMTNQICRVLISGRFISGAPFGAEQEIQIK